MNRTLVPLAEAEKEWASLVSNCLWNSGNPSRAALILNDLETQVEMELCFMNLACFSRTKLLLMSVEATAS